MARITREALRAARTITGDYGRWIGKPGSKPRFEYAIHVVLAADGSRWVTADHQAACWELTYDADTGLKRVWFGEFSPRPSVRIFSEEYAHVPPGEPDGGDSRAVFAHPTPGGMGWELFGVVARIALANPDGEAKTGRFDGRPVWIVSCPVMPREPSGPSGQASLAEGGSASKEDELSVSVDQETGLPVRVQAWVDGKLRAEGRLVNLTVDETVPADTFTLGSPVKAAVGTTENGQLELRVDLGTKTTRMLLPYDKATVSADEVRLSVARVPRVSKDLGFRPTSMNQVGSATGRVTLVPARIPAGFALQSVAVKRRQQAAGPPADSAAAARAGTGVVMLHYRAAMQEITVTTRRLDPTVSKASAVRIDPFIGDKWPGWIDSRTPVKVTDGAFAGARGAVVIAPLTIPHLWAVKDGVLLTVAGDCSAEELLAIAESMEPWTAGAEAPLPAIDLSGKP